jgi:hypothetical protein
MCLLKCTYQFPWLVLGDFNEVQWEFEHLLVHHRPERHMVDFCDIMVHCELHDLGFSGRPWTYGNMQKGLRNVQVRLDWAVASPERIQLFWCAQVQHLVSSSSDHSLILLELDKDTRSKGQSIFRYEVMWEREISLHEEIERAWGAWGNVQTLGDVTHALAKVKSSLKRWSQDKFGSVTKEFTWEIGNAKWPHSSWPGGVW